MSGVDHSSVKAPSSQRAWDSHIITETTRTLLADAVDDSTCARFLAVMSAHSGNWLNAPPLTAAGLRMDNEVILVAVRFRLGATLCMPHVCSCGVQVDARGSHGLSCHRSAGRHMRHSLINELICRALGRAGVAAMTEPSGLVSGTALRPDGATLIPWVQRKCLAWDATTPDTLAASHINSTGSVAGSAAMSA